MVLFGVVVVIIGVVLLLLLPPPSCYLPSHGHALAYFYGFMVLIRVLREAVMVLIMVLREEVARLCLWY